MEKIEGIYTYRCNDCETVMGIVSRFGVSSDCQNEVQCPKCQRNANLYGEGHIKYFLYPTENLEKKPNNAGEKMENLQYPIILGVSHISEILGISKRVAYEIMNLKEFPTIKIRRRKLVNREDFFEWVSKQIHFKK